MRRPGCGKSSATNDRRVPVANVGIEAVRLERHSLDRYSGLSR